MSSKYAGADWVEKATKQSLSDFGRRVADLLGDLTFGIYHIEKEVRQTEWTHSDFVQIKMPNGKSFASYDGDTLTRLVILCHDRAIRVEVSSHSHWTLLLTFHQRQREGSIVERHPTIEEAVASCRAEYGEQHD